MNRIRWEWALGRLLGGCLLTACILLPGAAAAQPSGRKGLEMEDVARAGMRVNLDVLVDGSRLPTVEHEGKIYLPVPRLGAEFTLRVHNHGPRRIAAIVSVDGLSVINGQPASERSPGYLVAPGSHIVIPGWRRSLERAAAFHFVDREASYASRTGRPDNIGVIGLVAFEEQRWVPRFGMEKAGGAPESQAKRAAAVGGVGTGYGRDLDSRAWYVPFVRGPAKRTVTLYYDTEDALRRAGVLVGRPLPLAFPGDGGFAPPPPGHKER
jgi:hypothetical protein